ncbi:MAG: hypothetical protein WC728_17500 [Elusimicrobiota bacterium]
MMTALLLIASLVHAQTELYDVPALSRADFNRLAAASSVPLYWKSVSSGTEPLDPASIDPVGVNADLSYYVKDGRFTDRFRRAYLSLAEARRQELVRQELDQGRPVVLVSDFKGASPADRALVQYVSEAGKVIDDLYLEQKGALRLKDSVPPSDLASRALFWRNQGPWCEAPKTEHDPFCSGHPAFPPKRCSAYPEGSAQDEEYCRSLDSALLSPFTVVRRKGPALAAVPLTEVYGEKMRQVSKALLRAAQSQGPEEAVLKDYLLAAAQAFETNDWEKADEAWTAMGSRNSKWYLRIAPDEVDWDPCQVKAGFHVSFGRIDTASLEWQDKLSPLKQEMEDALARLIGPSYTARQVAFGIPDFIEIVLNNGDSRMSRGAVAGQSLPNWGKVAQEGRRRTMVMTNIGEDPESKAVARQKAAELFDPEALAYYPEDKEPGLLGVILHEAAHNLGPHSDTKIDGKGPAEVFGGRLESVLEELKAQTAALWYVDLLLRKGLIDERRAKEIYVRELFWSFGHVSLGLFTDSGEPKPYSQLAAIQLGSFVKDGAMERLPNGRFRVHFDKLPASIESLMRRTGVIKATGDAQGGKALVDAFVSGPDAGLVPVAEIQAKLLKYPKETYLYTVLY